jgi:NADPH:quinone reductase-like Zn-dependent oxidoreductase/SAM-dependent methyltransferase/acyl carrier protein
LVALVQQYDARSADRPLAATEPLEPAEALWRRALIAHPAHLASIEGIARWGEDLRKCINSGIDPGAPRDTEPNLEILDQLYDSDPLFRCTNEKAVSLMRRLCGNAHDHSLRILEVDGATAGLTAWLLPALSEKCAEYLFTDPSETAVARAKARFAGLAFLRCEVLDLDQSENAPKLGNCTYDVVVSAAPRQNLARVRAVLKPGGILVATVPRDGDVLTLAFAQVAGKPEPTESDWHGKLVDAGFEDICCVDDGIAESTIILARNPAVTSASETVRETPSPTWVVFAKDDRIEPAATARRLLALQGHRVILVSEASAFRRLGLDRFEGPVGDRDAYAEVLRILAADDGEGNFHFLHLRAATELEPIDALALQERGCIDLFTLVQALIAVKLPGSIRLTLVTCGATPASESSEEIRHPWQAPLLGFARTLMNERPDFGCRVIDLDPDATVMEAGTALVDEVLHPDLETEVARRRDSRFAPRLIRGVPPRRQKAGEIGFRLVFSREQGAASAALQTMAIPRPSDDEVTVRVRAAGLNFRDVIQRIGLLPEEAFEGGFAGATLGMEFTGEVIEVGRKVEQFHPGDAVFGIGRNSFSSHVVAPAFSLYKLPATMSFEDAATLPVALITVQYSLHHIARLRKGERILIHGAAGGVGLAAIQYAQSVGAEIFASAGTPEKRNFLGRLGVQHVVDSRTLEFADDIMKITNGEGIDVVLNSVAGEAIRKGLSILRPHGRFIELGKRDFYANSKIGLQPFLNNIHFFGVDLDRLLADRPDLARELFAELMQRVAEGTFTPLPHRVFPVGRAEEAFRCMQHSRHIGKIVLRMDAADRPPVIVVNSDQSIVSPDATYLVAGGRGGFGLATTEWLARKGARNIAVVGRSDVTAPETAAVLDQLRSSGVDVCEFSVDIGDGKQVAAMFEKMRRTMPPLRGIIHCAAVMQDFALSNMTLKSFREVLHPKIGGAWNLHCQSLGEKLDFFVMYSSGVTLFGNEGQANYTAANLFLEALASYRHGLGLPAITVGWGTLSDVGLLTRHSTRTEKVKERLDRLGVKSFSSVQALEYLERAIEAGTANLAIAEMSWSRLAALPGIAKNPKYALVREFADEEPGEGVGVGLEELRTHLAKLSREDAVSFVQSMLTKQIAGIVGVAPSKIAVDHPLTALGMDSLMIVELQIGLDKYFGIVIPTLELVDMVTVAKLGRRILDELGFATEPSPGAAAASVIATAETPNRQIDAAPDAAPEPALETTLGRLLERELDRAKEVSL